MERRVGEFMAVGKGLYGTYEMVGILVSAAKSRVNKSVLHSEGPLIGGNRSMNRIGLFILACVLGGAGGVLGSMVGHSFGKTGLWIGGVVGGIIASILVARIALWFHWIGRSQLGATTIGTVVGFLLACAVAVNTLASPIGPILSTLLIGAGALVGARASNVR